MPWKSRLQIWSKKSKLQNPNKMKKILIILFVSISQLTAEVENKNTQDHLVKEFKSLTYTRGWVFGMLRVNNSDQSLHEEILFSWSMTAYAFNYWLLSRNGYIEIDEVFDHLIIRTFKNKELSIESMNDPLMRYKDNVGAFSSRIANLTNSDYDKFVADFKNFVFKSE